MARSFARSLVHNKIDEHVWKRKWYRARSTCVYFKLMIGNVCQLRMNELHYTTQFIYQQQLTFWQKVEHTHEWMNGWRCTTTTTLEHSRSSYLYVHSHKFYIVVTNDCNTRRTHMSNQNNTPTMRANCDNNYYYNYINDDDDDCHLVREQIIIIIMHTHR